MNKLGNDFIRAVRLRPQLRIRDTMGAGLLVAVLLQHLECVAHGSSAWPESRTRRAC